MPVSKRAQPTAISGWMNTRSAAEYLGVAEGHLRNMRSLGTGPTFHKRDGVVRYRQSDLDAWLIGR